MSLYIVSDKQQVAIQELAFAGYQYVKEQLNDSRVFDHLIDCEHLVECAKYVALLFEDDTE